MRAQQQSVLEDVERQDRMRAAGNVVTVLERTELERAQWRTLADVLEHVPGLHVSTAGGRGHPAELFVRGQTQHQTVFLLDGIDLSDPAQMHDVATSAFRSAGAAIPHLLIDDIERVEVWRGPQSARFGSGAVGGVVRITTRRGGGSGTPGASAWTEFGAFGTNQSSLRLRGGGEQVDYTLGYTTLHTRGITSSPDDAGGHERDGYDNDTFSSRVDLQFGPELRVGLTGRFVRTENELDLGARLAPVLGVERRGGIGIVRVLGSTLLPGDARARFGSTRQLLAGAEAELRLLDGWRQTFSVNLSDHASRETDRPTELRAVDFARPLAPLGDPARPQRLTANGDRLQIGWRHELELAPEQTLVLGAETERETLESFRAVDRVVSDQFRGLLTVPSTSSRSERARTNAVYAEQRFRLGALEGALAARLDDRNGIETQPSALLALEYLLETLGTRLHGSLGTAFRAPALDVEAAAVHRLRPGFDPRPGEPQQGEVIGVVRGQFDAAAERSRGFEAGVEQPLLDGVVSLDVTYFQSRTRNVEVDRSIPLGLGADVLTVDTGEVEVKGVETALELRPASPLQVSLYHTYTRAEEKSDTFRRGADRLYQPKHEAGLRVGADFFQGTSLALDVRYVGKRRDLRDPTELPLLFAGQPLGTVGSGSTASASGYTVVDVAASHTFLERYTVFARVENLLDRKYEDRRFVGQPGIAGYLGVRVEF